jgi:two-component system KDP operon response regulator KdpE
MKILVIDDDEAMTELLSLILAPTLATIITSNFGAEGIGIARKEQPDIIILDLMMPEVDGWQVCKKVREFSSLPILILSALDNPGMVAAALDAGADDYLIKPVPSNVLIAHINNLLRRSPNGLNRSPVLTSVAV